jgi:hypothetical protein
MSALSISTAVSMSVPFGMGKIIDVVAATDGAAQLPYVAGKMLRWIFFLSYLLMVSSVIRCSWRPVCHRINFEYHSSRYFEYDRRKNH